MKAAALIGAALSQKAFLKSLGYASEQRFQTSGKATLLPSAI
jgi:hypothetical protein